MLPAQPPNSRRNSGTRNDTFNRWILSGRMWLVKRSLNTMMVSQAIDPQIRAAGMEFLSDVNDELRAVLLNRKTPVRDRAQPRRGGHCPAKRIEMRLHETAAAICGPPADQ